MQFQEVSSLAAVVRPLCKVLKNKESRRNLSLGDYLGHFPYLEATLIYNIFKDYHLHFFSLFFEARVC